MKCRKNVPFFYTLCSYPKTELGDIDNFKIFFFESIIGKIEFIAESRMSLKIL